MVALSLLRKRFWEYLIQDKAIQFFVQIADWFFNHLIIDLAEDMALVIFQRFQLRPALYKKKIKNSMAFDKLMLLWVAKKNHFLPVLNRIMALTMEWNKLEDRCHCHQVQIPYFWYLPSFNLENYQLIIKKQTTWIAFQTINKKFFVNLFSDILQYFQHPNPPIPFLKVRESKKLRKGGGSVVQEQVFLKRGEGGWHFPYLIFSRFIILHSEIALPFIKFKRGLKY